MSLQRALVVLLLVCLGGCRDKSHEDHPKRPGDVELVHPLARNVRRSTVQGRQSIEMDVPVSVQRTLAYYEHGLAGSWHLVERRSSPLGTTIRVRRGRQLLDIHLRSTKTGTHVRIVQGVVAPGPQTTKTAQPRTASVSRGKPGATGTPPGRVTARQPGKAALDARPAQRLPRDIRLPKGWSKAGESSYLNKSRDLSRLAQQLQRAFKAQGWTVMPTPGIETSDRPDMLDLVFSKKQRVFYFHLKGTVDGTILTWVTASL